MMLAREEIRDLYRRRARWYDISANAYYVIGFREWADRRPAVRALRALSGVARAVTALAPGGRLVVLNLKEPEWEPRWLVTSAAWLPRLFGVTADLARRYPWEVMSGLLTEFRLDDVYFGFAYVASGTAGERRYSVRQPLRSQDPHNTRSTCMKTIFFVRTGALTDGIGVAGQQSLG